MDNMEESFVSEVIDESPPSYSFEDEESGGEDVEEDAMATDNFGEGIVQPYMFEPLPRNSVSTTPAGHRDAAGETDVHPREHWDVTQW